MTRTTITLTPTTDQTPAVVRVSERRLSGPDWVNSFPGSSSISDLDDEFGLSVSNFISAIKNAGGYVSIAATYRPPERAYLMHWSWMISHEKVKADEVPPMMGVHIEWDHGDDNKSKRAAAGMVSAYGMGALKIAPALRSRHTERKAIDMNIGWRGTLKIIDANGDEVEIRSSPSSGMDSDLHKVGKSYGVIKFWKGAKDKPHWSTDGR